MSLSIVDLHALTYLYSSLKADLNTYKKATSDLVETNIDELNEKLKVLEKLDNYVTKESGKGLFSGKYSDLTGTPTKLSQFTNDPDYATKTDAKGYVTASETSVNTKIKALSDKIDEKNSAGYSVVSALPETGVDGIIYLLTNPNPETDNKYLEYIYVNGKPELISGKKPDLSNYLTKDDNAKSATSATTAEKLKTARTIQLSGAVGGSASFDGSGNINMRTYVGFGTTVPTSLKPGEIYCVVKASS